MIQDRDPGDENDYRLEPHILVRITALLCEVGLPEQRILERTVERQRRLMQAQRQHHQGRPSPNPSGRCAA